MTKLIKKCLRGYPIYYYDRNNVPGMSPSNSETLTTDITHSSQGVKRADAIARRQAAELKEKLKEPSAVKLFVHNFPYMVSHYFSNTPEVIGMQPVVIDMTGNTMKITNGSKGHPLVNNFVQTENINTYNPASYFRLKNLKLGDYEVPVSNISRYWGLDNKGISVKPLSQWRDNLYVMPVMNKNNGYVLEVLKGNNPLGNIEKFHKYSTKFNETYEQLEKSIAKQMFPNDVNYLNKYRQWIESNDFDQNKYDNFNKQNHKLKNRIALLSDSIVKYDPNVRVVLNNNNNLDTIPISDIYKLNAFNFKTLLANDKGNSVFIGNGSGLNDDLINQVNNLISRYGKLYPILTDEGRYNAYYPNGSFDDYIKDDLPRTSKLQQIFGIKK